MEVVSLMSLVYISEYYTGYYGLNLTSSQGSRQAFSVLTFNNVLLVCRMPLEKEDQICFLNQAVSI